MKKEKEVIIGEGLMLMGMMFVTASVLAILLKLLVTLFELNSFWGTVSISGIVGLILVAVGALIISDK